MMSLLLTALAACGASGYPAPYAPYAPYAPDYENDYYYVPKAPAPAVPYPYYAPYEPEPFQAAYAYYPYRPEPAAVAAAAAAASPLRLEERAAREAALPVGQETWYESEPPAPRWRQAGLDDVNAAFLQNLIISQMAQNAESRARALARAPHPADADDDADADAYGERDTRDFEDEDVRELKALAGKPLSHSAKTELHERPPPPPPTNRYLDYYDYPADDSFINWGSKRAPAATAAPSTTTAAAATAAATAAAAAGQREEVMLRPATPVRHPFPEPVMKMLAERWSQEKRSASSVYDKIKHMLASENFKHEIVPEEAPARLKKRFVSSEPDLAAELHGLKRRMAT